MDLAAIGGVVFALVVGIALHLFTNAIPKLSKSAVKRAARRLPVAMRQDQEAAWLGDLAVLETDFERLRCAAGCCLTTYAIRKPFALEKTHRDLLVARQEFRFHGAITLYVVGRLTAWDTPSDSGKWGYAERLCVGILLASGKFMPRTLKKYAMCLEEDLKARPRSYASQEEAAKDLFIPIYREIKILEILLKHDLADTNP